MVPQAGNDWVDVGVDKVTKNLAGSAGLATSVRANKKAACGPARLGWPPAMASALAEN